MENESPLNDVKEELLLSINRFKEKIDIIDPLIEPPLKNKLTLQSPITNSQIKILHKIYPSKPESISTEKDVFLGSLKAKSRKYDKYDSFIVQ